MNKEYLKLIKEKSLQFLYDELDLGCSNDYQDKKEKKSHN